ncbi:MAG TPA: ATP-binding protein [Streptosporangiaceae bacterium]|nr:ATP-binding protein [Streptosporangiaceae bacterium]
MARAHSPEPSARHPGWVKQWWLDRSVRAKAMTVLAVPLIALVGISSSSWVLEHEERASRAVSIKSFDLITTGNQVLTDAVNAETGVRGYVATSNPSFLEPYNLTLSRIGADRRAFRAAAAVQGVSSKQQVADHTLTMVLAQLALLKRDVSHGASPGSLAKPLEQGKDDMDRLRGQIASLNKGPSADLLTRRNATNSLEDAIGALAIAGLILGLIAVLAGIALFTFGVSRRVDVAATNAERLGHGEPLVPVARARDELGRLACALGRAGQLLDSRAADLITARDQAVRATQAKNSFLSSTSHELRTPLNSILGFTQLLELSDLSEEDSDSVQRILVAGRHLLALINELIDIARIESGDLSLSLEPVAIAPLIHEAAQLMAPLAADRSVRIDHSCDRPALAAYADRQRFSQILVNLVSNAVKYNKVGGTITITCGELGQDQASVTVTDTGRGMSADDLERIFMPFERLGAEQSGIEGTGIGLPLAKALSEAMQGRLTATSVPGEGSQFTITLPRAPDLETRASAPSSVPGTESTDPLPHRRPERSTAALVVLYVEDNPANVEVVARYLRANPETRLASCPTGREGIDYATAHHPDLILLDLHLQDGHGEQALAELKSNPATADIPVVVLSADASPGMIRRLLAGGALAYLTKPLDLGDLGAIIEALPAPAGARPNPAAPDGTDIDQPPEARL